MESLNQKCEQYRSQPDEICPLNDSKIPSLLITNKPINKPVKLVPFAEFGFQVTRDEETLQGVSATEQALEHPVSSACLLLGVPRASSFSTAALQAQRAAWRRSEFLNHGES